MEIKDLIKIADDKYPTAATFHTWGNEALKEGFETLESEISTLPTPLLIENAGKSYIVTCQPATSGRGGMDQGSPKTYSIKKVFKINLK